MQRELGKTFESQMGFEPTTLRDLVTCSNHWANGDFRVSKGQFLGLGWNHIARLHSGFQSRPLFTIESPVAQLLEHRKVMGSNPIWDSDFFRVFFAFNFQDIKKKRNQRLLHFSFKNDLFQAKIAGAACVKHQALLSQVRFSLCPLELFFCFYSLNGLPPSFLFAIHLYYSLYEIMIKNYDNFFNT